MLIAFVNYLGLGAALFVSALLLQDLFGLSAAVAGAVSIPLAVATAVGAAWSGRAGKTRQIIRAIRTAATATLTGTALVAGGVVALSANVTLWACVGIFIAGTCAMGFSFGTANTPVNYLAMASLPKTISGAAGSSASASRQLGQSTGVATSGMLLGLGVTHTSTTSAEAYLLPGVEIAIAAVLLLALLSFYTQRRQQINFPEPLKVDHGKA